MPPRRILALVDCNSFYASWEKVFAPALADKPVVVLSNNDGCIIARSAEAKALGIPMGKPAFECQELFRRYGVDVLVASSRIDRAFTPSRRVYCGRLNLHILR